MDLTYGFANARVKAMESLLLKPEQFRELSVVGSLPEIIALLENTVYKNDLVEASQHFEGIEIILHGLQANFLKTLKKLGKVLPPKAQNLYALVVAEWDVQDLKTVFSKKMLGTDVSEEELTLASEQAKSLVKRLLAAGSLQEMLNVLKGNGYSDAVKQVEEAALKYGEWRKVLDALDQDLYSRLVQLAMRGPAEENTRRLLKERLELINTLLVLRLKPYANHEQIQSRLVMPPSPAVRRLLESKDVEEAVEQLGLPEEVLDRYRKTHALSTIELALEKRFVQDTLRKFRSNVLSFGVVLGYLYLKSAEVSTIKRLALGKYFGVEEEMRPYLYWVN